MSKLNLDKTTIQQLDAAEMSDLDASKRKKSRFTCHWGLVSDMEDKSVDPELDLSIKCTF